MTCKSQVARFAYNRLGGSGFQSSFGGYGGQANKHGRCLRILSGQLVEEHVQFSERNTESNCSRPASRRGYLERKPDCFASVVIVVADLRHTFRGDPPIGPTLRPLAND